MHENHGYCGRYTHRTWTGRSRRSLGNFLHFQYWKCETLGASASLLREEFVIINILQLVVVVVVVRRLAGSQGHNAGVGMQRNTAGQLLVVLFGHESSKQSHSCRDGDGESQLDGSTLCYGLLHARARSIQWHVLGLCSHHQLRLRIPLLVKPCHLQAVAYISSAPAR